MASPERAYCVTFCIRPSEPGRGGGMNTMFSGTSVGMCQPTGSRPMQRLFIALVLVAGCAPQMAQPSGTTLSDRADTTNADIRAIFGRARDMAADSRRGRGPWTSENESVAHHLADELEQMGARPVFGGKLLVPFIVETGPRDTVHNV